MVEEKQINAKKSPAVFPQAMLLGEKYSKILGLGLSFDFGYGIHESGTGKRGTVHDGEREFVDALSDDVLLETIGKQSLVALALGRGGVADERRIGDDIVLQCECNGNGLASGRRAVCAVGGICAVLVDVRLHGCGCTGRRLHHVCNG